MRKLMLIICGLGILGACDKHDPILPGVRTSIFDDAKVRVLNKTISDIPDAAYTFDNSSCKYTQDSSNVVWDGSRKIFSGFPTNNSVSGNVQPICDGRYVYAGLTTGELVKINPSNRQIVWIADIYRSTNLTGGSSMVDIVAPIVPYGKYVYVGGLGDAFCRVSSTSGIKSWCLNLGVGVPFVIAGNYAFVVGTDDYLYAVRLDSGDVYWRTAIDKQVAPIYSSDGIVVGRQHIDVSTGKEIK